MSLEGVKTLAVASVRARRRAEALEYANSQRITLRCSSCGWYMKNILMAERERVFNGHLKNGRHTRWLKKDRSQQKTLDRHAGYSWAK